MTDLNIGKNSSHASRLIPPQQEEEREEIFPLFPNPPRSNYQVIVTDRFILRPVVMEDKKFYIDLFSCKHTLKKYAFKPKSNEQITQIFLTWVERWNLHPFSALVVLDKKDNDYVGHAICGHGNYRGYNSDTHKPHPGFSEAAIVIRKEYWNSERNTTQLDQELGVGSKGYKGTGKEVGKALLLYAKFLASNGYLVPCDVPVCFQDEVKELHRRRIFGDTDILYKNSAEKRTIQAVFLPFSYLYARFTFPDNVASQKILHQIFCIEDEGYQSKEDPQLFCLPLLKESSA